MAAHSQSFYRALLVPDWRINTRVSRNGAETESTVWDDESSYTEAGPHPSVPEPLVPGRLQSMTLEASGEYVSASPSTIVLYTSKPGHASRTSSGANFVMSPDGGTTKYGWDRPGSVFAQDLLDTSTTDQSRAPHLVTLPSGAVICAYQEVQEAAPGTVAILTRTRAAATGTWAAEVSVYSGSTDYSSATGSVISNHGGPCMVVLPSGRVLLFCLHEDVSADRLTVRMFYSDDEGVTWKLGSKSCLPASVVTSTYTIRRIRAAHLDGQIMLLMWRMTPGVGPSDEILQFASDDMGGSFSQVGGETAAGLPDVLTVGNRLVIVYVPASGEAKVGDACWSVLASAWSPLDEEYAADLGTAISTQDAAAYDASSNIDQASKLCLCQDERGILFAYFGATAVYSAMQDGTLAVTTGTWEPTGTASIQPIFTFASGDYLREITACMQRGRVILAGSNTASTATTDHYLACWYLGGYTNVELPASDLAIPWLLGSTGAFMNIPVTWMPFELPTNTGWSGVGTPTAETPTASGTSWYLHITCAAGNRRYYEVTPTADPTNGIMAHCVIRSNTTQTAMVALVAANAAGGANDYHLVVHITNTAITMYDEAGPTQRATASHGAGSGFVEILCAAANGKASVWYRVYDANEQRKWIALGTNQTLTAYAVGTTNFAQFGSGYALAARDIDVMLFGHANSTAVGRGLATGQTNPDDLHGRPLGGQFIYITDGISARATGGPAIGADSSATGDAWQIPVRYDYPVDNFDPRLSPSPRDTWRSTQAAADESIAWQIEEVEDNPGVFNSFAATDVLGIHLENINFPQARLEFHAMGSWATLVTLTAAQKVTYSRQGSGFEITFASAGFSGVLREDELVGGTLQLGTTSAAVARKINRNTGGVIVSGDAQRRPRVFCDAVTDTDSASGTGYIWFPRITGVRALSSATTFQALGGLRIVVDDSSDFSDPPDGYFECGLALIGNVYVFGFDPNADRTVAWESNVEVTEDRSGRRRTRVQGPGRRSVTMNWSTPGVDLGPLYDLADDTIAITSAAAGQMAALRHEVPLIVQGLMDHMDGEHTPAVYLPRVAAGFAAQTMVQGSVYGRLSPNLDVTTVLGDEEDDELVSFGITLTEEV